MKWTEQVNKARFVHTTRREMKDTKYIRCNFCPRVMRNDEIDPRACAMGRLDKLTPERAPWVGWTKDTKARK